MCSDTANIVPRELLKGAYVLRHCKYWGQKSPPSLPWVPWVPSVPSVPCLFWSVFRGSVPPLITQKNNNLQQI